MKLVSGIVDSGFFAQSALSAEIATKDSLGRNISETYLTSGELPDPVTIAFQQGDTLDTDYDGFKIVKSTANSNEHINLHKKSTDQWLIHGGLVPTSPGSNKYLITDDSGAMHWDNKSALTYDSAFEQSGGYITAYNGTPFKAGDEFPQSATEAIEVVTANSGDWNNVSAKLDKAESAEFYTTANESGFATTSQLQTVSGDITGLIPTDLFTKASADTLYQPLGDYLTTGDSANFYTTANESGFATTSQLQTVSGDITGLIPTDLFTKASADTLYYPLESNPAGYLTTETDWTDTITAASSYAYEQATAAIPQPQDLSYISGKVDDLSSGKLDTTAFSDVSGSFLTAHQELPESANWNSTYNTVHDNSASWTGGGATLPVSGSAGENSAVYGLYDMKLEYNLSSDGGSEPEHTYVQIGTNSINTYESYDGDQTHNEVNIYPGYIEFYNDGDGYVDFAGYDVTNWQSTHETVSNNSATWGGGASYTGDAQGALDEVYSNSANWNETYSAVSSNSADWNTVIDVSAGSGIVFNKVNNVVYIEADIRTGSI